MCIRDRYINYKSIVPKDFNTMFVINRKEFLGAVERSMLIADTSNSTNPLRLDILPEKESIDVYKRQFPILSNK